MDYQAHLLTRTTSPCIAGVSLYSSYPKFFNYFFFEVLVYTKCNF